jgi:hypothetical protein
MGDPARFDFPPADPAMRLAPFLSGLILTLPVAVTAARDRYVDPVRGNDRNDGYAAVPDGKGRGPVRSIRYGVRFAEPGDTVHLAATARPYHESPVFHDRIQPADKPITLDGHGAVITGAELIDLATWDQVAPGRYRKAKLLRTDEAVIGRYFFRINGRMQHMGRTSKGPSAKLKAPADLAPGEWTYVKEEDAFYVQIDPKKTPADYVIEAPMRSAGVQISGSNENIVIRNLHTRHVYNDGFNIHGYCRNVLLENVSAVECGDDGISAHDDCRIVVDGFTSIGNSTGFCHTNDSWSDSRRVLIRDCLGFDVFVLDTGRHALGDSLVFSSAANSVVVLGPRAKPGEATPPGECALELRNVGVIRTGENEHVRFQGGSAVSIDKSTFADFHVTSTGSRLTLRESIVTAPECRLTVDAKTELRIDDNLLDVDEIRIGPKVFPGSASFFRHETGSSRQMPLRLREPFDGSPVSSEIAPSQGGGPGARVTGLNPAPQ